MVPDGPTASFLNWRAGPIRHYAAVSNNCGLRKHCRIWEGRIPCLSSAGPPLLQRSRFTYASNFSDRLVFDRLSSGAKRLPARLAATLHAGIRGGSDGQAHNTISGSF